MKKSFRFLCCALCGVLLFSACGRVGQCNPKGERKPFRHAFIALSTGESLAVKAR